MLLPAVAVLALLAGGCTDQETSGTGSKSYVAGDGSITQVDAADRKTPGAVEGETLEGKKLSLAQYRGQVVVLNFWGSWCSPCIKEAPTLVEAAHTLMPQGVAFVGVDTRESSADNGRAYQRKFDVPYSSLYDRAGEALLAFHGSLPPNATPSTVVLDKQGRAAAVVLGQVPSAQTLEDLVADASRAGSGSGTS